MWYEVTLSRGGKKYFTTFIDDCTRFCYIHLLNSEHEVIDALKQYKWNVESVESKDKMIRIDRGG